MTQPTSPFGPRPTVRRDFLRRQPGAVERREPALRARRPRRPPAMRRPGRPAVLDFGGLGENVPAPPSAAVLALNRLGFGPRPGEIEEFEALGAGDPERLAAWVAQQLAPASIDDSEAESRLAAAGFETLDKTLTELWNDHVLPDPPWQVRMQPLFETERATFLRAVYSRRQLFELLVDFWHNHFNVYAFEFSIGPTWVYTDRDVIRADAFGNFRTLLEAVAQSPSMLYYLDNRSNSADGPNENYARELLELHGLGAEAYLGSMSQSEVPLDGQGRPIGFVDEDVTAMARCLTGWTLRDRAWHPDFGDTGEFFVYEPWHDVAPKHFLGADMPGGRAGLVDGRGALDLVAEHPATGRFVAGKLCRRLIGDQPPPAVVEQAAAVFTANVTAPDQIALVLGTILQAPEFLATWADKVKRPFEIAVSALRATEADWNFALDDEDTDTFLWRYYQGGQPLFSWHPPNGYPDFKQAWTTTSPRVMTWKLCNWFSEVTDGADAYRLDLLGQTPPGVRSANALADFWARRVLGRPMPEAEQTELALFMAQGVNPDYDLPLDDDPDVQSRLRAMVGLIFMAPAFLWR